MRTFYPHSRVVLVWLAGLVVALTACSGRPEVPPPRPTVVVVTAVGPYYTSFDEAGDWLIGETVNSRGRVEEGRYVLTVMQPEYIAWTHEQRAFGDGTYEVDASLLSGPEASGFGLLLLATSDVGTFFYCMITGDGRYDIGYCQDGCQTQQSLIGGYTLSYVILTDNQTNRLRVDLLNGQLTFWVNGSPVSQIRGLTYSSGLVGLIGESSHYGGFEAAFDNLRIVEHQGN